MTPTVGFGMTLYNNARHLPEALESLLTQSDPDFGLLLLDDGSTDATATIAQDYAARDARIRVERHPERCGMVQTWRDAVTLTRRHFPGISYFAWASDHDRWHPDWLRWVKRELDAHPEAVLAYPRSLRIGDDGALLEKQAKIFDTAGRRTPRERWLHFSREAAGAGDLVYGLMRVDALERAGTFRSVLQPDRLLMLELTLQGEFRQVPEVLWFRRTSDISSLVRQRTTLFTPANRPRTLWLPPWLQHGIALSAAYLARPGPGQARGEVLGLILRYQALCLLRRHSKSTAVLHRVSQGGKSAHQIRKEVRGRIRWAIDDVQVARARGWIRTIRGWRRLTYGVAIARRRTRKAIVEGVESIPGRLTRTRRRVNRTARELLIAAHAGRTQLRRFAKRGVYRALVLTHRLGLRGRP